MTIENVCVHTGLGGIRCGEYTAVSGLMDEYIPNPESGLFVSDFDNCITRDDFGTQCFEIKLHNGEFWKWPPEQFSELLLPTIPTDGNIVSYYDLLEDAVRSKKTVPEKIHIRARTLLKLHQELLSLYAKIQQQSSAPLRNEFAEEMKEFDKIVLSLEGYFSKFFGNQIFSRLRFFAGKSTSDAKSLANSAIDKGQLQINQDLLAVYESLKQGGADGRIITTNLLTFVKEAVNNTLLKDIFLEEEVLATKMRGTRRNAQNPFILDKMIDGEPVFGTRKAQLAKQESIKNKKKLILAAGDSHRGDGPMLAEAIAQGGVNIIPVPAHADIEQIAQNFEQRLCEYIGENNVTDEQRQRMWYLQTNNFVDARG